MAELSKSLLQQERKHTIYFVVGPTAAGKSAWALKAAQQNNGIIVNADSIQIYKRLNIGSAKPSVEDQKKVAHFLYDLVEPSEVFTAGDYYRAALKIIAEHIEHKNIYFVGGSGFYIQALEKGMYDVGPISEEIQNKVLAIEKGGSLFSELQNVDAQAARKIGAHDPYRLQRALSVVWSTGKTMAEIEIQFRNSNQSLGQLYNLKKIGVTCDRDELRARVVQRTQQLLDKGLVVEVRELLALGFGATKALSSIGYKECVSFIEGRIAESQLSTEIINSTMQLAKRQMTWFKRDAEIDWLKKNEN